ncbi:acyl-CoA thioesterase [Leptospira johnsonii]|uniref:4-hydroxybenzoyl-CoA thioesterase n=1 Tax=Leptospira johnsonii TaxID=1917820 RepID=A0A2P2D088_9LEPT|nr:acyl-CoA thioesterase [Leptospira johnsonii]GBF38059.1 4-hydroxybenzoyl-CoA thioesterase [Leptospira johnsonii]
METAGTQKIREGHKHSLNVRWDELDANRHVNNKNYQGYLDEARMRAMRDWGAPMEEFADKGFGPVILNLNLKFVKEISYPEEITIESDLVLTSPTRAVFEQKILLSNGKVACQASTEWTLLDLNRKRPAKFLEVLSVV